MDYLCGFSIFSHTGSPGKDVIVWDIKTMSSWIKHTDSNRCLCFMLPLENREISKGGGK